MRLLFISHKFYPDIGGIETISELLVNYFSKLNIEVHLLTWTEKKNNRDFSFKVIRNPDLFTLFKEHYWADVVFENNPALRLSWPQFIFQKPNIIAIQTWLQRRDKTISWQDNLKKKWLNAADSVIAISRAIKEKTFANAQIIPNSYEADLFQRLPEVPKTRDFVFLGRLVSDKGADMAVELINLFRSAEEKGSDSHNLTLTIIGDGPEKDKIKEMVNVYGLSDYINLTGYLKGEELSRELNKHKYLLVPSRWEEPFGIVALEGMACGCLPFVSNGGGLQEAVGDAGVIFERNNLHSLYKSVKEILEHPQLENELRSNAEEHLRRHRPEVIAERYFEVIQKTYNA